MRRSLVLKRETLSELSAGELAGVAGGSHLCVTDFCGHGASFDDPCPTIPINVCLGGLTDRTCITISPDVCIWTR